MANALLVFAIVLMTSFLVVHATEEEQLQLLKTTVDRVKDRLFSVECEDSPHLYSSWSDCIWPHGDLRRFIRGFVENARNIDCKVPPRGLVRLAMSALRKADYDQHPLYKKIPRSECGFCGRRAQCCTKARSFLTQSFRSSYCDSQNGDSEVSPCEIQPLDEDTVSQLRQMYPDIPVPEDKCDVSAYVTKELDKLHNGPAIGYIKSLLCQILGTTRPSFSCVNVGDRCACCCFGFKYEDGSCVPNEDDFDLGLCE